jgi:UDPglucose 6-dehydrogenase
MSKLGYTVVGIDSDSAKISALQKGQLPFYEPGLAELLVEQLATGRLTFTTSFDTAKDADIHFLCVGTPQKAGSNAADLTYVNGAFDQLLPHLKVGSLVAGKSTVPVGTADLLAAKLDAQAPHSDLAWNPEFLREGFAIEDTLEPNRLVVGVRKPESEKLLAELYAPLLAAGVPWISSDLRTAELVKVAANSFLATKISFINAMAEICEAAGGDVTVLAKAIGYDPRIGSRFLQAGIGFGGGCLPKDIRAFMARAEEIGANQAVEFLREIDAINLRARTRMVDVVSSELSQGLKGARIAVLGAAFKPDSDDVRDSPALDICAQIQAAGADVTIHDPKAIANAQKRFPGLKFSEEINQTLQDAELVLHLTEWKIYREINPTQVKALVKTAIIIDGRNALDRDLWVKAGWKFRALGRSSHE